MNYSRLLSLGLAAVVSGAGLALSRVPVAARADGLTCGWCWDFDESGGWIHHFPSGGDECGWPSGSECARCGGTSSCHTEFQSGKCHIACGGQEFALGDLAALIRVRDATAVARMIREANEEYIIAYLPDRRVVEIVTSCNPGVVASTIALDAEFGSEMEILLAVTE